MKSELEKVCHDIARIISRLQFLLGKLEKLKEGQ
jgi:hypothetical protein